MSRAAVGLDILNSVQAHVKAGLATLEQMLYFRQVKLQFSRISIRIIKAISITGPLSEYILKCSQLRANDYL